MYIKQIYTNCLSEAAYYIESDGEAAIIDPLRDTEDYILLASERKCKIKYIFETHFHADFVSGHIDLAHQTGAPIIFGPGAETSYPIHNAKDGEIFSLGKLKLEVLHTPGHTLESCCYLLKDESDKAHALFTGDTLFVGDVGRPDLSSGNMTSETLAGILYDSIHGKLFNLPDEVLVYPAHGPGSSCGKNLGPSTSSTIGEEKKNNAALKPKNREAFIEMLTDGLAAAPKYFPINAKINQQGYTKLSEVIKKGTIALKMESFNNFIPDDDIIILDSRQASEFTQGFIPGSVFIGLEGRFAEWAGSLLPFDKKILLVTPPGKETETVVRLARVGFENIAGCLEGGFEAWKQSEGKTDMIIDVEADELLMDIPFDPNIMVVDVRREIEYADGHLPDALNLPLIEMTDPFQLSRFEEDQNLYVHCAGGYRSVIAASLLKRQGIHNLRNVLGGWSKIKEQEKVKIIKEKTLLN